MHDPLDFLASRWKSRDRTFAHDVMGWKTSLQHAMAMKHRQLDQTYVLRFDELVLEIENVVLWAMHLLSLDRDSSRRVPARRTVSGVAVGYQDIEVLEGVTDAKSLGGNSWDALSEEALVYSGAWASREYAVYGFSKYAQYVNRRPQCYEPFTNTTIASLSRLRLILYILWFGALWRVATVGFI